MGILTTFGLWFGLRRKCRECQSALKKNVTFCQNCGTEAPFACLHCGVRIKPGVRFCPACGKEREVPQSYVVCNDPKCGKEYLESLKKGCPACGNKGVVPRTRPVCGGCGQEYPESAKKFCPHCGARKNDEISAVRPETIRIRAQRWEPDVDQFAVRVDQLDLGEHLESGIVIEPGVLGVLVRNGQPESPLLSGRHQLSTLPARKDGRMYERADIDTMILVCSGDQALRLVYKDDDEEQKDSRLTIADNAQVDVVVDIVMKVRDPLAFVVNVLAGKSSWKVSQFLARYKGEMRNGLEEAVAKRSWESLTTDKKTKKELLATLADHARQMLERDGMELVSMQALEVHNPEMEDLDAGAYQAHLKRRALNLDLMEFEVEFDAEVAELDKRERRMEVTEKRRDIDHAEKEAAISNHKRRAELIHDMERQVLKDTKLRLTTEAELNAFVQEADKDGLLLEDDLARFKRDIASANEDQELAREHCLARLKAEREFELRALKFENDQGLSRKAIDFQLEQERNRLDHQIATDQKRLDADIAARRANHFADLEIEATRRLKEAELRKAEAKDAADVSKIALEIQKLEDDHDLALREKKQALDLKEQSERLGMALQAQQQQVEMQMKLEAQSLAGDLEKQRISADVEKTRIQAGEDTAEVRRQAAEERAAMAERYAEKQGENAERDKDRIERIALGMGGRVTEANASKDDIQKSAMEQMGRVAAAGAAAGKPKAEIRCPKCSSTQSVTDKFCTDCGAKIT